jgi:hypothetical protein
MGGPCQQGPWVLHLDRPGIFQSGHLFSEYGFHVTDSGFSLSLMSLKWRWCLLVVIAAAAFGVFIPNSQPSTVPQSSRIGTLLAAEVPIGPITCLSVSCNKGTPAPTTPLLNIAAVCAIVAGVLAFALTRTRKRIRPPVIPLPQGHLTVPFRPPQFSSF